MATNRLLVDVLIGSKRIDVTRTSLPEPESGELIMIDKGPKTKEKVRKRATEFGFFDKRRRKEGSGKYFLYSPVNKGAKIIRCLTNADATMNARLTFQCATCERRDRTSPVVNGPAQPLQVFS